MTFGTGTLQRGSTGDGVTELQQWLIDRGFLIAHVAPTGTFDEATEHAVKAFQLSAGIGVDGLVGGGTRTATDGFASNAAGTGWHPNAIRNVQVNRTGGSFTTDTRRGVLHTTEGTRLPNYASPPHFTVGRNGAGQPVNVWQHYPVTVAARALRHPSGTAETNRHGAIQIEYIGSAADSPTFATTDPDQWTALGQLMRWIETNAAVANASNHAFDGVQAYGLSGTVRLSEADWLATIGWVGHQHVPHNTHWDPGQIDITALLAIPAAAAPAAPAPAAPAPAAPTPAPPRSSNSFPGSLGAGIRSYSNGASPGPVARPRIRATTRRLSNSFPSLTFAIDTAGHPYYEVVLTTDARLFVPTSSDSRNETNFYAGRTDGLRVAEESQGRYIAPVHVIRQFAESNPGGSIYYTIVGYADSAGSSGVAAADPTALAASSPSVPMAAGFKGHTETESLGVPLSLLRPRHRNTYALGNGGQMNAGGVGVGTVVHPNGGRVANGNGDGTGGIGNGHDADHGNGMPPNGGSVAVTIDTATDRAQGEDGYDFRMSSGSMPEIPVDLRPAAVPPTAAPSAPPSNGAPPSSGAPPAASGAPPAQESPQTQTPPSADPHVAAGAPEQTNDDASYDDGYGPMPSAAALESSFPQGHPQPAALVGVEAPLYGTDDEYEDLRWAGGAYSDNGGNGGNGNIAQPANGAAEQPPPTNWRPDLPQLSTAEKRQVVEAFVGTDTGLYVAVNPDGEFAGNAGTDHPAYQNHHLGLSFGLGGFSQDSGELGELLTMMRHRDEATFDDIFGAGAPELIDVANRPGPLSKDTDSGRSVRVQPVQGADLWEEPWISRFRRAGEHRPFQGAQIELASGLYLDPTVRFAADLGLATQRGMAIVFDRAAHRGVTGGLNWIIETVGPFQTTVLRNAALEALGFTDVEHFQRSQPDLLVDDQFGPLTHAALAGSVRTHPALSSAPPVQILSYAQMIDAMAARATGQPWGDRIVRLAGDADLSDEAAGTQAS